MDDLTLILSSGLSAEGVGITRKPVKIHCAKRFTLGEFGTFDFVFISIRSEEAFAYALSNLIVGQRTNFHIRER